MSDLDVIVKVVREAVEDVKTLATTMKDQLEREDNLLSAVDRMSKAMDCLIAEMHAIEVRVSLLETEFRTVLDRKATIN